jgi:hypothetical protein
MSSIDSKLGRIRVPTNESNMKNKSIIPSQQETVSVAPNRKLHPMLAVAGAAACICLASCVAPYDAYGGGSSVTTTSYYQPGYRINSLPSGYRTENISGSTYYYQNGNYYRRDSNGYVVIDAPRTSRYYDEYGRLRQVGVRDSSYQQYDGRQEVIRELPRGYRVMSHGGREYYQAGERYYTRSNDGYIVVTRPY